MLELSAPVGLIMSRVKELESAVVMRTNALAMKTEEFASKQKQAMERIEAQREEKEAKVKEVKELAESTPIALAPMVEKAYTSIEATMVSYVEEYPISPEISMSKEAMEEFQEGFSKGLNASLETAILENTEIMQNEIQKRVQQVVEDLQVFSNQLTATLQEVENLIPKADFSSGGSGSKALDYAAVGLEVVTNFTNIVPGLGAAITGFRDHGFLGGVVGLGVGYATTMATAWGTAFILASLGVATAAITAPALVISGIIGALGGKKIVNMIFGKPKHGKQSTAPQPLNEKQLLQLRTNMVQAASGAVTKMKEDRELERWLEETSKETFSSLSMRLDQEAEQAIQGMEDTWTKIQVDLAKSEAEKNAVMKEMKETKDDVIKVLEEIKPIKDKMDAALNAASKA